MLYALTLTLLSNNAQAMEHKTPKKICDEIFTLLNNADNQEYIGEEISQLDHALQCARFASDAGYDDETIIAALLHDIGHLSAPDNTEKMDELGVLKHEQIGAEFLKKRGFPEKVAELVKSHVDAKRYLVFTKPDYYNKLSEASKKTLKYQGGAMTEEEAREFEQDKNFATKIKIREWDERAKQKDMKVYGLESYQSLIIKMLCA